MRACQTRLPRDLRDILELEGERTPQLDEFVTQWAEGKFNDSHNDEDVKRALLSEFDLKTLAANFQSAFV